MLSELLKGQSVPTIAADDVQWVRGIIHNAEGAGVHVVGAVRPGHHNQYDNFNYNTGVSGYTNGNQVRDSQAFTPWQEWGQPKN